MQAFVVLQLAVLLPNNHAFLQVQVASGTRVVFEVLHCVVKFTSKVLFCLNRSVDSVIGAVNSGHGEVLSVEVRLSTGKPRRAYR